MIFASDKPKNCRGCEHKDACGGVKRKCYYRMEALEKRLSSDLPCKSCAYARNHPICFPCYRNIHGQEGIKEWKDKHPNLCLE